MKKKKITYIIGILMIILLVGGLIYLLLSYDNEEKESKDYEEFVFYTNDEINDVKKVNNGYEIKINNYYPIDIFSYIRDEEKLDYIDITVSDFKLDNVDTTIKFEDFTISASCITDEKYSKITMNDILIEDFQFEECYLAYPGILYIIEEKYLGIIYFYNEASESTLVIYNNKGEKVYIRDIVGYDLENFKIKDYEEDDENYYINEYKLVKKDGQITDVLTKKRDESFCDMMNNIGKCEE